MLLDLIELDNYLYYDIIMIEINNLTANKINKNLLKKAANDVLRGEKIRKINLSVALVSPKRMKELNKKYRKKNLTTDVLAFPDKEIDLPARIATQSVAGGGEIIICPRQVKKNAKIFGENFKKELARVLIHGILHLLGYDHEKSRGETKIMEKKQNYYLAKINNLIKDNLII